MVIHLSAARPGGIPYLLSISLCHTSKTAPEEGIATRHASCHTWVGENRRYNAPRTASGHWSIGTCICPE